MAMGVVWLVLGLLYWSAILIGAFAVFVRARKGRRALCVAGYFIGVGILVASTAMFPPIGAWVWTPIFFVLMLPWTFLKSLGRS